MLMTRIAEIKLRSGTKNIGMAGELRFQFLCAAQFDNPVAAIAQRFTDLAVVLGLRWRIMHGAIDEDANPGQPIAREIEIHLDGKIGLGAVLGVVR